MQNIMPHRPILALLCAASLLAVALPWAAFVANSRHLSTAPGIPYLTNNVAMSVPVATVWTGMAAVLARLYLTGADDPAAEGLKLGLTFAATGLFLDGIIVAVLVGRGWRHFKQGILWLTYAILIAVPWGVGLSLAPS